MTLNVNGGTFADGGADKMFIERGKAVGSLPIPVRDKYNFLGWYTALDGGTKVAATTKVTTDATYYAHWEYDGLSFVSVAVAEGCEAMGSVSGGNATYKAGAKVSLKATANRGYVFVGWRRVDGESAASSPNSYISQAASFSYVANGEPATIAAVFATSSDDGRSLKVNVSDRTTEADGTFGLDLGTCVESLSQPKFTVKGLPAGLKFDAKTGVISGKVTKPGTYKVTVSATNATVKQPVTTEFEIVAPNLTSEKLPGLEQDTKAYGVVTCGVAFPTDLVDCSPEDGWTVKAAGLPAGLKFTAKDIVDSKTKEVTIPANTIYGVPTKAGTFTVTFAASKRGEPNQVATITLRVEALPAWAQGTFNGYVVGDDGECGSATMTVAANGKVSGKIALGGTNWTLSATSYDATSVTDLEDDSACVFVVKSEAKAGKVAKPIALEVRCGGEVESLANGVVEGEFCDGEVNMWRGMWKDKATAAVAKAELAKWEGVYTLSFDDDDDCGCGYLSLTVGKDGNVKATGKLADGTSVSATSPLMYSGEAGYFAYFYSAPTAYKGGAFALTVSFVEPRGELGNDIGVACWTSRNPEATGDYGNGFYRDLEFAGAYYNKLESLYGYYRSLRVDMEDAPELPFSYKETYLDENNRKVTESWIDYAVAIDGLLQQPGLTAAVNEKGAIVVAKATKPVQDKTTKEWAYDGANDGALTLSFTQATGIFKGSYTFWYDYESAYDDTTGKSTMAHTSKKVSFEGIFVQGEEPKMEGFYLWDATGEYEDEKTGKLKSYKYKQSFPVRLVAE